MLIVQPMPVCSRIAFCPGSSSRRARNLRRFIGRLEPILVFILAICCGSPGLSQADELTWEATHWIWGLNTPDTALDSIPAETCYFRAGVAVTERAQIKSADLLVTADNLYEVSLNGRKIGGSTQKPDDWSRPKRFNVAGFLTLGHNSLAVEAVNTARGPAGLLLKLRVVLQDGTVIEKCSDKSWVFSLKEESNWRMPDYNSQAWGAATEVKKYGEAPWNKLPVPATGQPPEQEEEESVAAVPDNYRFPDGIVFIGEDCSLQRPEKRQEPGGESLGVTVFTRGESRAFPEHDLPGPIKVGHKMYSLVPAKPGTQPQLLVDAGRGAIGSPAVSFDGEFIYFSMVKEGEGFYHIYKVRAKGGSPVQLTFGNFHDIDPVELADGRIAFVSTRCGFFEEYHNTPSRSLFTMDSKGGNIEVLTSTFIFDNEPKAMADGRIIFVRSDNFFDRGKVETLLHAMYPDGSHGYTEFGMDLGPAYGNRLRAFYCGSPAPMPDGRVAYVTGASIAIGRPGSLQKDIQHYPIGACDVAAMPDGRLLCAIGGFTGKGLKRRQQPGFSRIAIIETDQKEGPPVILHDSLDGQIHSPVYLGQRQRPEVIASPLKSGSKTGILFCQDARFTRNTEAGWSNVKAIRVLMGKGLTMRSSHSYIVHAGNETVDLGTVPLAPDGSFSVEVPADAAIAFQAVDAEGRSELNEMSWIYVRGGETRGCVGCHAGRQLAPSMDRPFVMAATVPPLRLTGEGDLHRFRGNNPAVTGMTELQFDRFREVAGLNTFERTTPELVKQLTAKKSVERVAAINRLAITRDLGVAPALADCLKDPDREVRVAAAMALASCGTPVEIAALEQAKDDADLLVRRAAEIALDNFAASEDDLVRQLGSKNKDSVRRAAAALGHIGSKAETRRALRETVLRWRDDPGYQAYRFKWDDAKFLAGDPANPRMIQEVIRATGRLKDRDAVPMLVETLKTHSDPETGNLFIAEAAAEALGLIAGPDAEKALIETFSGLKDYVRYTHWYGDHDALMACHMSPVHYRILEALDRMKSTNAAALVPHVIRAVPTDFDRALFTEIDAAEMLMGRFIRNQGMEATVVESCLSALGDAEAKPDRSILEALKKVHGAWGGKPPLDNRAAQVISIVCAETNYAPLIRAAYARYMTVSNDIPRVFSQGIPVVDKLPVRHWICFYLGRTLGNLRDTGSVDTLLAALRAPGEFAAGSPDPLGPGLIFLHNDLTPCWRAAAAWALGEIGDKRAIPDLLKVVGDFNNATEIRHAAAESLGKLGDASTRLAMRELAKDYPEVSTRNTLIKQGRPTAGRNEGQGDRSAQ